MSKSIILTTDQWSFLRGKLKEDYPPSVILIRPKMKSVLGFVDRTHNHWDPKVGYYQAQVHLDFYNEPKRTMFLLKYSEFLKNENCID